MDPAGSRPEADLAAQCALSGFEAQPFQARETGSRVPSSGGGPITGPDGWVVVPGRRSGAP